MDTVILNCGHMEKEAAFLLALLVENSVWEKPWVGAAAELQNSDALEYQNARPRFLEMLKVMVCSPLQKLPAHVNCFIVNSGTELQCLVFSNLVLCIIPKLCISGSQSASSQVNCKS